MKKLAPIISIFLVFALLLSVSGCNSQELQKESHPASSTAAAVQSLPTELSEIVTTEATEITTEATVPDTVSTTDPKEPQLLNLTQRNSVAMLNYLAMVTQEINASSNSRLFLEEAYSLLINNTNPEVVDERTEEQLSNLLDVIESHRMVTLDRERTQYAYEQKQANVIASISGLGGSPREMLTSLGFAALDYAFDSVKSYQGMMGDAELDYLESTWQLDRDEAQTIHETRKSAFTYMTSIVREYQLPGELALNEKAISDFVEWRRNTNVSQQLQFFESKEAKATYSNFGPYWLELSNCYLKNKEYEKCLAALDSYEAIQPSIFRRDYYYAKALPNGIVAAASVFDEESYISYAEEALNAILENTDKSAWDLRYFAAEAYVDLYQRSNNQEFLKSAYEITIDNVNNLVVAQRKQNDSYLKDVAEAVAADSESSAVEKLRKVYNEALKEKRKTELAPVYSPLVLNCDLLFSLANELDINQSEKNRINQILSHSGSHAFLNDYLRDKYSFDHHTEHCKAQFTEDELIIPAEFLNDETVIHVSVFDSENETIYDDWVIDRVERGSSSFSDFLAHYKSDKISDQEWSENSKITVELFQDGAAEPFIQLHFEVEDVDDWILWKDYTFVQVN